MAQGSLPLTSLSEAQRVQAQERLTIIRPALDKEITQVEVARRHDVSLRTIQRWIKNYREQGFAGLADPVRVDKGASRKLPQAAIHLIEGLALQNPARSAASIHRQMTTIATEQGWKPPSYARVNQIIKDLDPALVTLAHQGAVAYREEFDLLYRREAPHANAMWQADHTLLDIWLLDEAGHPARPWLTVIEDDYSRAVASFRITFQEPTALTTALALRTGIWRKTHAHWHICGIPTVFYVDHSSDFTSRHMEQVAGDLGVELIFSKVGVPRGRGKIERFFRSVNELFLQDLPGYAPASDTGRKERKRTKGSKEELGAEAQLTLPEFEQRFQTWLLTSYHQRVHSETLSSPAERWEAGGFVPRMPASAEQLDLLLLTVAKTRRVQQDGIRFQNYRYIDPLLAAYVKESVLIRYDPADMAELHVFYQDQFLCRAICSDLAGQTVSLKDIERARSERRKQVKAGLTTRQVVVEQFVAVHQRPTSPKPFIENDPPRDPARPKLKRYIND